MTGLDGKTSQTNGWHTRHHENGSGGGWRMRRLLCSFLCTTTTTRYMLAIAAPRPASPPFLTVSLTSDAKGGGYENIEGLQLQEKAALGILRSEFNAIRALGWNAKLIKYSSGYQYLQTVRTGEHHEVDDKMHARRQSMGIDEHSDPGAPPVSTAVG